MLYCNYMTAADYPISQPFGYDPSYPLNDGFHKGLDYSCPIGTSVVVGGVTIGLSGDTGETFGAHLHVGKFVNNVAIDPGAYQGFGFTTAGYVYATGYDKTNGNWVQIAAGGAIWCYLHLSKVLVTKNQIIPPIAGGKGSEITLKGEVMSNPTQVQVLSQFRNFNVRGDLPNGDPSQKQLDYYAAHDWGTLNGDLLQALHDTFLGIQSQLVGLQNKPPEVVIQEVPKIINQCVVNLDTLPADKASLLKQIVAFFTR